MNRFIIYYMKITILLLLAILGITTNPGILIGVPLPYRFPMSSLIKPPIDVANFTVMETEFTNIQIRQLDFNSSVIRYKPKTLFIKQCLSVEIVVKLMEAHFNFKHNGTYGPGTFKEAGMYLKIQFDILNKDGKAHIDILRIEMEQGAIKVELGGTVQQRILSTITNIVLKYAAPFFYSSIKTAIKDKVNELNKQMDSKIDYLNIHIDLSLINTPSYNSSYLSIPLNGASYINDRPGPLNPNDVLKPNMSKTQIQVLVHENVLDSALRVYLQKNNKTYNISMSTVSGVADINSLTLSPVFPAMATEPAQEVIFSFTIVSPKVSLIPNFASVSSNVVANIYFKDAVYCNPMLGIFKLNGTLIYGEDKIAVDVDNIDLQDLKFDSSDISTGKIYPEGWTTYQPTILRWLTSAFDGILFSKPQQIQKYGIKLYLNGEVKTRFMEISVTVL